LLIVFLYSSSLVMSKSTVIVKSSSASDTSSSMPQGAITALLPPLVLEQTFPTLITKTPLSVATFSVRGCPLTLGCVPIAATGREITSAPKLTTCLTKFGSKHVGADNQTNFAVLRFYDDSLIASCYSRFYFCCNRVLFPILSY